MSELGKSGTQIREFFCSKKQQLFYTINDISGRFWPIIIIIITCCFPQIVKIHHDILTLTIALAI
jgi:hypothetical protein